MTTFRLEHVRRLEKQDFILWSRESYLRFNKSWALGFVYKVQEARLGYQGLRRRKENEFEIYC